MKRTNTAKWMEKQQRWQINVQKDGVRKSFYSSTPGRTGQREANKKADLWLDEGVENQKVKVSEAYAEYLEKLKSTTSRGNWRPVESRYINHIKPIIGARSVATLSDGDLQEIIDRAFTKNKLSKKTISNIRGDMTAFIKFCRKKKYVSYIPEEISLPAAASASEKKILQPDELRIIMSSDKSTWREKVITDKYIYAYRFQIVTGLRPGELMGLRPEDCADDVIYVKQAININGETTKGKNKNARRAVQLTETARQIISDQIRAFGKNEYLFNISAEDHYRIALRRYCIYNGITVVTPYELRHTFVSIAKSLPEGLVKSIVGHSASMDTFGVYGHAINGESKATAAALEGAFEAVLNSDKNGSVL